MVGPDYTVARVYEANLFLLFLSPRHYYALVDLRENDTSG
jgi:hypothetical protein